MTTFFPKPLDKQVAAISDSVSQTQDGLAIVANGNNHAAISSGQFVYVKNHDTLAEGLYKATASISANGSLSTSNLTADETGGLNDLQGQVTALNSKIETEKKNLQIQRGIVTGISIPANSQTEVTVNLPHNYSGGNAYVAFANLQFYASANMFEAVLIRSQFANQFICRVYNKHTATIENVSLNWMTIKLP